MIRGLPLYDASDEIWNMDTVYREDYVHVKYTVARKLQPKRICEIGVYSGIAALCFLGACPDAEYVGIDNQSVGDPGIVIGTLTLLNNLGYNASLHIADSQTLEHLPNPLYDLVHVDADHSRHGAEHDVALAWNATKSGGHILVDNSHDMRVCAGVFDAMANTGQGLVDWSYLSSGVGSILINKGKA